MNNYYQKYIKYKTKYLKLKGGEFDETLQGEITNEIYKYKSSKKNPTFFITYGPPASGKGGIMEKVIKEENENILDKNEKKSDEHMVKIDIDSIIGKHPIFKKDRQKLLDRKMELLKDPEKKEEVNKINQDLQMLYKKYRQRSCTDTIKGDDFSDNITQGALKKGLDIAWETTGFSVNWTIKNTIPMVKKEKYNIVVVYPLVPVDMAIARAHEREKTTGQTPAPNIEEIAKNAAKNIKELKTHVDTIYIYDNSGEMGEEQLLVKYDAKDDFVKCSGSNNEKTPFITEVQSMIQDFCNK